MRLQGADLANSANLVTKGGVPRASPGREGAMRFRLLTAAVAIVGGLFAGSHAACAQSYPDKSVRMVVAFGAGGTLDTLARIVSQKLSEMWSQQVVVENRAGAGGNLGAAQA